MRLIGFLLFGYLPILGGMLTEVDAWYRALDKAPWHPPGWVFGPAWTLLYLTIGLSLWRLDRARGGLGGRVWALLIVHHALNAGWTPVFFGLQRPALALAVLTALFACILILWRTMWRHDRCAAVLWTPYTCWVAFATSLNAWIVFANQGGPPLTSQGLSS